MAALETITMNELIKRFFLREEDYNCEITDVHLGRIPRTLCENWKDLVSQVGMPPIVKTDIEKDYKTQREKRQGFFSRWKEMHGSDVTYKKLISALLDIGSRADAEEVCKLLQKSLNRRTSASVKDKIGYFEEQSKPSPQKSQPLRHEKQKPEILSVQSRVKLYEEVTKPLLNQTPEDVSLRVSWQQTPKEPSSQKSPQETPKEHPPVPQQQIAEETSSHVPQQQMPEEPSPHVPQQLMPEEPSSPAPQEQMPEEPSPPVPQEQALKTHAPQQQMPRDPSLQESPQQVLKEPSPPVLQQQTSSPHVSQQQTSPHVSQQQTSPHVSQQQTSPHVSQQQTPSPQNSPRQLQKQPLPPVPQQQTLSPHVSRQQKPKKLSPKNSPQQQRPSPRLPRQLINISTEDKSSKVAEEFSITKFINVIERLENASTDEKERLICELKRPKTLCVMACGLTGVGKSTLLNGLCGREEFQVGHVEPMTERVDTSTIRKDNYSLILCDTPGFEDELHNKEKYLKAIKTKCVNVDTLFYCVSVNATRIRMKEDLATLQSLRNTLDKGVWNSCVIVFTFANTIIEGIKSSGIQSPDKIKEEYERRMKMWEKKTLETFMKAGINPTKMPIVRVGATKKPKIFKTDSQRWLTTFWHKVRDISPPDGRDVLVRINIDRLQLFIKGKTLSPLHRQSLLVDEETFAATLRAKFPSIAAALDTWGVGGVAGAGIGGTIGALAFGVPTFGVAAGIGLALGGLIGGGIGMGIEEATEKIVKTVQNTKNKYGTL